MRKPQLNVYCSFELLLYLSQLNSHMIRRLDFMLISLSLTNQIIKLQKLTIRKHHKMLSKQINKQLT